MFGISRSRGVTSWIPPADGTGIPLPPRGAAGTPESEFVMASYAPATHLETHDVTNQPGAFAPRNLYATDTALREAVRREAGDWLDARMDRLGAVVGSERVLELGEAANRFPPEFTPFDRYGRRLDEARFHPAYHELMALAMDHHIHDVAWIERRPKAATSATWRCSRSSPRPRPAPCARST